jgi:predicted nucleic acid-binding protein
LSRDVRTETLICDTSFVGHLLKLEDTPDRYAHWDESVMGRVESELLAISVVTIAEVRAGYLKASWGPRRVARAERRLASYLPLLIDDPNLDEWARLSNAARASGVALSDNDIWVAATASVRSHALVTCDRDHVRIAPELGGEVLYLRPPV